MSESNWSFGRRSFLQSMALAALARACSSDDSGGSASPKDGGRDGGLKEGGPIEGGLTDAGSDAGALDPPFGVWRAMREALKSSPDSLADQAAKLVAAKDAEGLFTFVRDNIATLPPVSTATEKSTRWGPRATLRCGAGTPRERADLLASLLQQAGFQASVVAGDPDGDLVKGSAPAAVYLRTFDRKFQPADPPPTIPSWVKALTGSDTAQAPAELDPTGSIAQGLFDAINPLLPSTVSSNGGAFYLFKVPFVALVQGGSTTYLNPLLPNAVFGQPYATNIVPAPAAEPTHSVDVTLSIARASDPETQVPLVKQTYTADQLVGRQLMIQTHPSGAIEDLITSPISNIVAFVPTLAVAGVDLTAADRKSLMTTGSWVTQSGDILGRAADGTVTCNGLPLGKGGGAAATNVATVNVTANAVAFPQIELTVSALDQQGKPVVGLGAGAFSVSEDGTPLSFLMRDNGVTGPRVLFLVDTTGSEPPFPSAWATAFAAALFKAAPNASVQIVDLAGSPPTADGYTITDAASLETALLALPNGGVQSLLYRGILAVEGTYPTLILMLSDGNAEDPELKARALASLAGSAPVLALTSSTTVPTPDSPMMDEVASVSGGKSVNVGNLSDATLVTTPLSQMLTARATSPYRLSYTAPAQGPATRTVTVTANVKGTATYDVPAQPAASAAVVGLYLTVTLTVFNLTPESYTRVLGGWVPGSDQTVSGAIEAAAADARTAMLGSAVISFEGAPPTLSTWFSDSIAWRLATEPAWLALDGGDLKGAFSALGDVPTAIPREAPALHAAALPVPNALIYEESLRAVLFCTRAKNPPYHADILPFTRLTTVTPSSTLDIFRTNLLGSLRMAVAESAAFKRSAVSELQGKTLKLLQPGDVSVSDVPQVPKAQASAYVGALNQYASWLRLIASDGSTLAFWAVHPRGSCIGVLPDASGGGDDPCASFEALANILDILSLFSDILGVPYLSVWAELGKLVALAGVETLLAFNYTPVTVTPDQQFAALGCSIGSGMMGAFPASYVFKQEGVATLTGNFFVAGTVSTVVGKFSFCSAYSHPCK